MYKNKQKSPHKIDFSELLVQKKRSYFCFLYLLNSLREKFRIIFILKRTLLRKLKKNKLSF